MISRKPLEFALPIVGIVLALIAMLHSSGDILDTTRTVFVVPVVSAGVLVIVLYYRFRRI